MLQRMNELAVKAANGTNSKDDRDYIQAEVDQLVTEIDRVATTTKFNETYLLKGTNGTEPGKLTFNTASKSLGSAAADIFDSDGIKEYSAAKAANATNVTADATGLTVVAAGDGGENSTYKLTDITINSKHYYLVSDFTAGAKQNHTLESVTAGLQSKVATDEVGTKFYFSNAQDLAKAVKSAYGEDLKSVTADTDSTGKTTVKLTAFADLNKGLDVSLHVGADSTKDNKIGLTIEMMSARGLGVNGIKVDGADDSKATASIDTIKAAIQKVSEQRSALGAVQNRLDHTINNLDNVVENTTSAESAIRDTDMAKQMVSYSNNNILAQAGQAMLAQANQSNQGVLSLLR
jgi:flagellin